MYTLEPYHNNDFRVHGGLCRENIEIFVYYRFITCKDPTGQHTGSSETQGNIGNGSQTHEQIELK